MSDVFISYARLDNSDGCSGFVTTLERMLTESGKDVWVDWDDIPPGRDFVQEFLEGVDQADTVIAVLSPGYLASRNCLRELERALERHKRIIPIVYADLDFSQLPEKARLLNAIFFNKSDSLHEPFKKLLDALNTDLDHLRTHTRLLTRASEWENRGKDRSFLLSGKAIDVAELWLQQAVSKTPEPAPLHVEYINSSRAAATRRQRTQLTWVSTGLIVALVLAGIAAVQSVIAGQERQRAEFNEATAVRRADESQSLLWANFARSALENQDDVALPLALAAAGIDDPPLAAQRVLADAAYAPGSILEFNQTGENYDSGDVNNDRVTFSPDGRIVATGNTLWDATTGEPRRVFSGHTTFSSITAVAFSPDSSLYASAATDKRVIISNVVTGEIVLQLDGLDAFARVLHFTPDGSGIFLGVNDDLILWDLTTNRRLRTFSGHTSTVTCFELSLDGRLGLSASSFEGEVILWDVQQGEAIFFFPAGFVSNVAFSADATRIYALISNQFTELVTWETDTGAFVSSARLDFEMGSSAFSPDKRTLALGSAPNIVVLWDIANERVASTLYGYTDFGYRNDFVTGIAFHPDGRTIFTTTRGRFARWQVVNGQVDHLWRAHQGWVRSIAVSPDSGYLLSASDDKTLRLWRIDAPQGISLVRQFNGHESTVTGAAFSPDGQLAVSASWDNFAILWNVNTGQELRRIKAMAGGVGQLNSVAFSPDGTMLVTGGCRELTNRFCIQDEIHLWKVTTGELIRTFTPHTAGAFNVTFSPDGQTVLAAYDDSTLILWDVATGKPWRTFSGHTDVVATVAFAPDGKTAVSGSYDSTLILWDVASGAAIRTLQGHTGYVESVTFSPDGRIIASGSGDGLVILWDTATGEAIRTLREHRFGVWSVAFSLDGSRLISGSSDQTIITWRIDTLPDLLAWLNTHRAVRELTCVERLTYRVEPYCTAENATLTPTP